MSAPKTPLRVLVAFNSVQLYGMEGAVLRTLALLQPEVELHFVLTRTGRWADFADPVVRQQWGQALDLP